jgi:anthranilate 1,2-dioxygenase small subunit
VRLGIAELIAAYADCIDDDRLEEWPDFFVDDCRYLVTDRESHEAGAASTASSIAPRAACWSTG